LNNTVFHVHIQLRDTGLTAARECKDSSRWTDREMENKTQPNTAVV